MFIALFFGPVAYFYNVLLLHPFLPNHKPLFPLLCTTSNNGFSSRSNIAKLAQAPSLWSLLTELTGTQSLHCDRVSQAILSLLLHMRQNPEGS